MVCHEFFQNAFCCFKFSAKIEKTPPLQVTAREVMTFFWKSAPYGAASRDYRRSWPRKMVGKSENVAAMEEGATKSFRLNKY